MVLLPISGIEVDFPYEPYGVQRAYMARVINALRDGSNACLESPTGTGKSLALLCASLAWREAYIAALQLRANGGHDAKLFKAVGLRLQSSQSAKDGGATGQGEVQSADKDEASKEVPQSKEEGSSVMDALLAAVKPKAGPAELRAPRIVFSSRTHSQLAQVIRELKDTIYRPFMTVLGSRDQLCIHDVATKHSGLRLNRVCRQLTAPSRRGCKYHLTVMSPRDYENRSKALLQQMKDGPPKDIEDLGEFGMREGACPYYLTRAAATSGEVEVLFVPYNYLLNRSTRDTIDLDWANDVVIIDEAHNLESICSDAVSFDLTPAVRQGCKRELSQSIDKAMRPGGVSFPALDAMARTEEGAKQVIGTENREVIEFRILMQILNQMEEVIAKESIPKSSKGNGQSAQKPCNYVVHKASYLRDMMRNVDGFTEESAPLVLEVLARAMEGASGDSAAKEKDPVGFSAGTGSSSSSSQSYLRTLHNAIRLLFDPSIAKFDDCFRTVIQPADTSDPSSGLSVSYWCFSPSVAMSEFMSLGIRSLVLTSGTLAPMRAFSSELGVPFAITLENGHVIGKNQVLGSVICSGPDNVRLSSSFRIRETDEYKMSLGRTMVHIVRTVPDGVLVFFPSYNAMNSCLDFWRTTGMGENGRGASIFERIRQSKRIIEEPRGSGDFAAAILGHQANIRGGHGSILFAVCRGKVSEGIDFSDAYGRCVVIAGIPYPAAFDLKVILKKDHMTGFVKEASLKGGKSETQAAGSKDQISQLLSGEEWYTLQAIRAVNQAIGRAIRHKNDYGLVLFCDERFSSPHVRAQLSKWLRPHIYVAPSFEAAQSSMENFFAFAKTADFASIENAKDRKHRLADEAGTCKSMTGSLVNPLSSRAGVSAMNADEADRQIRAASEAIARLAPPPRSKVELQEELDRIISTAGLEPKLVDHEPPRSQQDAGNDPDNSILGLLGSRPMASRRDDKSKADVRERHAPKLTPNVQPQRFLSAPTSAVPQRGPLPQPKPVPSTRPAVTPIARTRSSEANESQPKRRKLSDDAKALFGGTNSESFRETFGGLREVLSLAKQAGEAVGPLQDSSQRDEALRRGEAEIGILVKRIRFKCEAKTSDAQVHSFLENLQLKIPQCFQAAYAAAVAETCKM
jgi:regulator of telomere elongation helicase 1